MNQSDHSEARERARQEFEKWANSVDYVELFDAWLAGRRSLEQERWISVEERLPSEEVLLYITSPYTDGAGVERTVSIIMLGWHRDGEWFLASDEKVDHVTHWHHLPPAPPVHKGDS